MLGSPPRVRGKGLASVCASNVPGITPACAGKSVCTVRLQGRHEDHPRVCGEKRFGFAPTGDFEGSPPRVRGKVQCHPQEADLLGITPACAGKSIIASLSCAMARDHPRVCGEKHSASPSIFAPQGSPPRVRGKGLSLICADASAGITPACAGKSVVDVEDKILQKGSPPRVRGKGFYEERGAGRTRITPACAGKRQSTSAA